MNKRSILIELTPLLDVIMIIMFLILVQSESRVDTMYAETRDTLEYALATAEANYRAAIADFEAYHLARFETLGDLEGQIRELNNFVLSLEEDAGTILVNLSGIPGRVTIESPSRTNIIDFTGTVRGREDASLSLNAALAEQLRAIENPLTFIVFTFDGRAVDGDEVDSTRWAINNARLHNENVFALELNVR